MPKTREQINAEAKAAQQREDERMRRNVAAAFGILAQGNAAINAVREKARQQQLAECRQYLAAYGQSDAVEVPIRHVDVPPAKPAAPKARLGS